MRPCRGQELDDWTGVHHSWVLVAPSETSTASGNTMVTFILPARRAEPSPAPLHTGWQPRSWCCRCWLQLPCCTWPRR